jgi:probable rRNA maturation factor
MTRPVVISNRHPRLRIPRAAVARAIALLDAEFKISPTDLLHLPASHKSRIINHKSSVPPGELSLVFLTDPALAKIHADFMGDPTVTDVITFEGDPAALGSEALAKETGLAGEICVSADTAAKYVGARLVRARGRAQAAPRQSAFATELTLYMVHGWLHLAGYDDLRPAKKRRMRAAEARAMKLLVAHRAIPAFELR